MDLSDLLSRPVRLIVALLTAIAIIAGEVVWLLYGYVWLEGISGGGTPATIGYVVGFLGVPIAIGGLGVLIIKLLDYDADNSV